MYTITDVKGCELPRDKEISVKVRTCKAFQMPGETTMDSVAQMKSLTPKDLEDLTEWFITAGYPTSNSPN